MARGDKKDSSVDDLVKLTKWKKAGMIGTEFDAKTFPDALDVVYWIRQVLGIVVGIVWGLLPITGAFGLIGYGGACSAMGDAMCTVMVWTKRD